MISMSNINKAAKNITFKATIQEEELWLFSNAFKCVFHYVEH